GTDGRMLEEVLGDLLKARGLTIAAAESCTGGLFTSRLTDVPGSSAYVHSAVVAYDNAAKIALLDVPPASIDEHGAVSEPVALAMAEGIRARTGADVAVGITGIAGPGGGTPSKPVGTVVVAVIVPDRPAYVRTFQLLGGRARVRLDARWVDPANMHLTVRFIGHVPDDRASLLIEALRSPVSAAPFEVRLAGGGAFPPRGAPRVFWIGVPRGLEFLRVLHEE